MEQSYLEYYLVACPCE